MYACIGKVTRLGPVPPRLKMALFNACVRPVMLYCTEALPLKKAHLAQLDQLQLQYIRWCLGKLPQSSPRVDTLAEAGHLPISYLAVRARISYYLLVKSRSNTHITTAALADAVVAPQKQDNWFELVQSNMQEWDVIDTDISQRLTDKPTKDIKQTIGSKTKVACINHWLQTLKGEQPQRPDWWRTTLTQYSQTHVLPLHLTDHRSNRWYKSQFCPTYRVPAPYIAAMIHLNTTHLRALCTFRMGIAQLHVHTGAWKTPAIPLLDRICNYCQTVCRLKAVEDPYHVCMECPLYDRARVELYTKLQSLGFDFTSMTTLQDMHTALMQVGQADTVRSVGRFLADCMTIRDTYHGNVATSQWINKLNKTYARTCVDSKPTTCDQSFAILRQHGCDVATCKPLAAYL